MKNRFAVGSPLAIMLLVGGVMAAGDLTSGPQVGTTIPGPFSPLNCNGDSAGQKRCLV